MLRTPSRTRSPSCSLSASIEAKNSSSAVPSFSRRVRSRVIGSLAFQASVSSAAR